MEDFVDSLEEVEQRTKQELKKFRRKRAGDLYRMLEGVPDYRKPKGKQYYFADLLFIVVAASIFGYTEANLVLEFCKSFEWFIFGVTTLPRFPSAKTIHRIIVFVESKPFANTLNEWKRKHFKSKVISNEYGHEQHCFDGKGNRAATQKSEGGNTPYSEGIKRIGESIDIKINQIDTKKNESGTLPDFILDQEGGPNVIYTADAAAFTRRVLEVINAQESKYLFPLKLNQKNLYYAVYEHLNTLDKSELDALPTYTLHPKKCHGRDEERICRVLSEDALAFLYKQADLKKSTILPYIRSIAVVDKTVKEKKDGIITSKFTRSLYVTNLVKIDPKYVLLLRSRHWSIEMDHYLLDNVLKEDRATTRIGSSIENGNILRRLALSAFTSRPNKYKALSASHYYERIKQDPMDIFKLLIAD